MVTALLASNLIAQKLFVLGPFTFTAGIVVFPLTYICGDVLTEVYGYARARRVIWMGFGANLFLAAAVAAAVALPPSPDWSGQREFAVTLQPVPRIVCASLVAYWCGEFMNSYVLARMKVATGGKRLWLRTVGSTVIGQAVDTSVFVTVALGGVLPGPVLVRTIASAYLFKVLYEAAATPLTYMVVNGLKRAEGIDVYDRETNFSPFAI
jgi:uncharacterized integral membrane protein (TIGR00697 family)